MRVCDSIGPHLGVLGFAFCYSPNRIGSRLIPRSRISCFQLMIQGRCGRGCGFITRVISVPSNCIPATSPLIVVSTWLPGVSRAFTAALPNLTIRSGMPNCSNHPILVVFNRKDTVRIVSYKERAIAMRWISISA